LASWIGHQLAGHRIYASKVSLSTHHIYVWEDDGKMDAVIVDSEGDEQTHFIHEPSALSDWDLHYGEWCNNLEPLLDENVEIKACFKECIRLGTTCHAFTWFPIYFHGRKCYFSRACSELEDPEHTWSPRFWGHAGAKTFIKP